MHLYHHTDTARLPWILQSGKLRPSRNRIGGFPSDVLWATSSDRGDPTASADRGQPWRSGLLWHIRFVLDSADFTRWIDGRRDLPGWTPEHFQKLEMVKGAEPAAWWFRTDEIAVGPDAIIEMRSYADNRWRRVDHATPYEAGRPGALCVDIGGRWFGSLREVGGAPGGGDAYDILERG